MTGNPSSWVAPTGVGGAPVIDPDLIMGVSLGSRLALAGDHPAARRNLRSRWRCLCRRSARHVVSNPV